MQRRQYFEETERYHMAFVDASKPDEEMRLPDSADVIVILDGV